MKRVRERAEARNELKRVPHRTVSSKKRLEVRKLRSRARLTQEELARLLGTSWVTVSRWEREVTEPSPEMEDRLRRLLDLLERIGDALPSGEFGRFLEAPSPLLRGHRPMELLQNDYSFEDLIAFVESAKSGDMA